VKCWGDVKCKESLVTVVCCQLEKPRLVKTMSDAVSPTKSTTPRRPSFTAGLARIIDRERRSYQELAERTAANELLALARSQVLQTRSPRMIDAGVQSDEAVDLLAVDPHGSTEAMVWPEKMDKATGTDEDWLKTLGGVKVVVDESDDVEHLVIETIDTDKQAQQDVQVPGGSASSETRQKCQTVDSDKCEMRSAAMNLLVVKQRSQCYADELLVQVPWASAVLFSPPRLELCKAVFTRSDEHMVIMEFEPYEEPQPEHLTATDQLPVTEGLLNNRVGLNSTKASHGSAVKGPDGN